MKGDRRKKDLRNFFRMIFELRDDEKDQWLWLIVGRTVQGQKRKQS